MEHNRVELTGRIVRIDPLRLSPSGVPHRDLEMEHRSLQMDEGGRREVRFNIIVRISGRVLNQVASQMAVGERICVYGCLGKMSHRDTKIVLSAQALERLN